MKKILCPVDLSPVSLNALEYAGAMAEKLKSTITIVHVIPDIIPDTAGLDTAGPLGDKFQEVKERFDKVVKALKDSYGVKAVYEFLQGDIDEGITKYVEEHEFDLIVSGTDGISSLYEYLYGSHTYQIADHVKVPVLAIPENTTYKDVVKIVFACNFMPRDYEVLLQLIAFSKAFSQVHITLLHIAEPDIDEEEKTELTAYFETLKEQMGNPEYIDYEIEVFEEVAKGLETYMTVNNADILALIHRESTFVRKLFSESVTLEVAGLALFPIFIFHEK